MSRISLFTIVACVIASPLFAGELQLRSQVAVGTPVVRIGDVAAPVDLTDEQWSELVDIELFPTPAAGETRLLSAATARELIALRTGESEIAVSGQCRIVAGSTPSRTKASDNRPAKTKARLGSPSLIERETTIDRSETLLNSPRGRGEALARTMSIARQRLSEATQAHLGKQTSDLSIWSVDFELDPKRAEELAHAETIAVTGGQAPWTGRQLMAVAVDGQKPFAIRTTIARHQMILVAASDLKPGDVLTDDDVEAKSTAEIPGGSALVGSNAYITSNDSIAEKTVSQPIEAGKPIPKAALKKVIAVRRGEMITVFSVAPGLRVKSAAKALSDAATGDLITLEEPSSKKQFQARVTASQEATVLVDVPKVAPVGKRDEPQASARRKPASPRR